MNNACPWQCLELRRVVQQAVHQGARDIARSRVHDQPRRLVDDQQLRIFKHDIEGDGFGLARNGRLGDRVQLNRLAAVNSVLGPTLLAIDQHGAVQQPALEAATGKIGKHLCQCLVQTQTGKLIRDRFLLLAFIHGWAPSLRYTRPLSSDRARI